MERGVEMDVLEWIISPFHSSLSPILSAFCTGREPGHRGVEGSNSFLGAFLQVMWPGLLPHLPQGTKVSLGSLKHWSCGRMLSNEEELPCLPLQTPLCSSVN